MRARLPRNDFAARIAPALRRRTEGNPLFVRAVLDHLVAHGRMEAVAGRWVLRGSLEDVEAAAPETLRQMIARSTERLGVADRRLLEAACVAGVTFSAAAVAPAVARRTESVARRCAALARGGQFLRPAGTETWPDGTVTARYRFTHELYQDALYRGLDPAERVRLHRTIGRRQERGYAARTREIAGGLAMHFARGQDLERAVRYAAEAGKTAIGRSAHREAAGHLRSALELIGRLPPSPERTAREATLRVALGGSLVALEGYGAPEVEETYARAREGCRSMEAGPQLFRALSGLVAFHLARARYATARALNAQRLRLARRLRDPALALLAHLDGGTALFYLGEFAAAKARLDRVLSLYERDRHRVYLSLGAHDPAVAALSYMAWTLGILGYADQAVARSQEALALARELGHPLTSAFALDHGAVLRQLLRDPPGVSELAGRLAAFAQDQGFPFWYAQGAMLEGWARAASGRPEAGIDRLREGLEIHRSTGAEVARPYCLALLAESYGAAGRPRDGLSVAKEALRAAEASGEAFWTAEIQRLEAELLFAASGANRAEAHVLLREAAARAAAQGAKLLELRAAVSWTSLGRSGAARGQARRLLAETYRWFREGLETPDLREAEASLRAARRRP